MAAMPRTCSMSDTVFRPPSGSHTGVGRVSLLAANTRLGKNPSHTRSRRVSGPVRRELHRGSGGLAYDGRRGPWIGETVTTYSGGSPSSVHTTDFAYDGNQIVLQFDATSTPGAPVSLTATNLSHRYLYGPAVDQVLADEQLLPVTGGGYDLTSPGNVVWTLADNEGTIRDLAVYNATTGTTSVVNHRIYDPFGKLLSQTNPATGNAAAVDCLFGCTGCATDGNTDIEFHERRVKTSGSPDWLSPDPINLTSGVTNLDDYCGNDPINATDPTGLAAVVVWLNAATMPANFNVSAVQAKMRQVLSAAGVRSTLTLMPTTQSPASLSLGWQYDRSTYWGNGTWWALSPINPLWWGTASVHDLFYYYPTRNVLSYDQYVTFLAAGTPIASTKGTKTEVFPNNVDSQINPQGGDVTTAYANVLLHEVYWFGVLGHWSDDLFAAPLTLGCPIASSTRLMTISRAEGAEINARVP